MLSAAVVFCLVASLFSLNKKISLTSLEFRGARLSLATPMQPPWSLFLRRGCHANDMANRAGVVAVSANTPEVKPELGRVRRSIPNTSP